MTGELNYAFSFICGQNNCWYLGGSVLPMCQRCTGLYVGSACALLCWLGWRPKPASLVLWAHGVFLLLMIPFGYHLVPQTAAVRTITGWLFAFGLVYYMATFGFPSPVTTGARPPIKLAAWSQTNSCYYFGCLLLGIVLLLAAIHFGAAVAAHVLSVLAALGVVSLMSLSFVVFVTLARGAFRRFSRA